MISCDTNILFYSLNKACLEYGKAKNFLESQLENDKFCICELVLVELYVLLRNPKMNRHPASAQQAVAVIQRFRSNPRWRVIDYPGGLMNEIWGYAGNRNPAYRSIFDARLAFTLLHHNVKDFATRNVKDFESFNFRKTWDPLQE
ncbi:MAG: TA system VapC family ribonuclease toxin [Victivallales bacterium]|jgi:toxin-antitoxin system PIN domain toxin